MQRAKLACRDRLDDWFDFWDGVNEYTADSKVGNFFRMRQRKAKLTTEVRAGLVTFLTTAYILSVNALILSDTGGPCNPQNCTGPQAGQERCVFTDINGYLDPGYARCMEEVKRELITATAASSLVASALMGLLANLPVAAAPGMGLNAYFAYNVVGTRGSGRVSYQTALGAVFIEGWIFIFLAVTGLRLRLIRLVPKSIMLATSAGIGLYLAFIGLQNVEGLGVVSYDSSTLVTLGGCPAKHQAHMFVIRQDEQDSICQLEPNGTTTANLPMASASYACMGHKMESASVWLGIAGLIGIAVLMSRSFRGSVFVGIFLTTVVAWIPGHAASYLGGGSPIPGGQARLDYFKQVVSVPRLNRIGMSLSFDGFLNGDLWIALITFLYVDFLDTTGTLFSSASFLNNFVPGFVRQDKTFERHIFAFSVDGLASVIGSLFGTSPVTAFIESASGIREGGRTGLTALTVAFFFFLALFFTPILATIPPYAVGPALITVGALMMMNVVRIKWDQAGEALPAFATMITMPLTYSVAYGVIAGIVGYIIVNSVNWLLDQAADLMHYSLHGKEERVPNNMRSAPSFSGDYYGGPGGNARDGTRRGLSASRRGAQTPTPRMTRKTSDLSQRSSDGGPFKPNMVRNSIIRAADPGALPSRKKRALARHDSDVAAFGTLPSSNNNNRGSSDANAGNDASGERMSMSRRGTMERNGPSRRSSIEAPDFTRTTAMARSESEPDLAKLTAAAAALDNNIDPRNSKGLQAAASRLQQLFEEAQLPNGTSIWPPTGGNEDNSTSTPLAPSRNTSRDSLWGMDVPESRTSDSIMGTNRNLPRVSPWNWSPRASVSRPIDQDGLEPHEEADEEENETSAGVVLRSKLVGLVNRISSRISSMSGGGTSTGEVSGRASLAEGQRPDFNLPSIVPETDGRPSFNNTSMAWSEQTSEAGGQPSAMMRTQTSIMQTQGSTAPLVIPPARQPGLLKSIGSRMASRREARAGRGEASASPGQEEQAAGRQLRQGEETQLPEADTPSERLPAELTGWPPRAPSSLAAVRSPLSSPAQQPAAASIQLLPAELTGWPPRQGSTSMPKPADSRTTELTPQMRKINSGAGARFSVNQLSGRTPGGNAGSPGGNATFSSTPGGSSGASRGQAASSSRSPGGADSPSEILPEELTGWPPRRPIRTSSMRGTLDTPRGSVVSPSAPSDSPGVQFDFDKSVAGGEVAPQNEARDPEGSVAIAMPDETLESSESDQLKFPSMQAWDTDRRPAQSPFVREPESSERAQESPRDGRSSSPDLPPRSLVNWFSRGRDRNSGSVMPARAMVSPWSKRSRQ